MQLFDLAQHGTASYADARSLGLDPSDLRRMSARGEVLRLVRGWYAVRPPTADSAPWEGADRFDTARRRHLLRTVALVRSFEGRVVASHQSALVLHGVDLWRADLDVVHLTRTTDDHSRHRRGAVIHPASSSWACTRPLPACRPSRWPWLWCRWASSPAGAECPPSRSRVSWRPTAP